MSCRASLEPSTPSQRPTHPDCGAALDALLERPLTTLRATLQFVKLTLIAALALATLGVGCHARPSNDKAIQVPTDVGAPCVSPDQAGCSECCVEQPGPTPDDQACYLRRVRADDHGSQSKSHEYAEQAELRNSGPCPATCRTCAACTRDHQASYDYLRAKGCDCFDPFVRQASDGPDPCYSDGCGCTCAQLAELSACGPRN